MDSKGSRSTVMKVDRICWFSTAARFLGYAQFHALSTAFWQDMGPPSNKMVFRRGWAVSIEDLAVSMEEKETFRQKPLCQWFLAGCEDGRFFKFFDDFTEFSCIYQCQDFLARNEIILK